jgi:acyl-CoA synthetase (AMP-forming)/AMP-acid ligase II
MTDAVRQQGAERPDAVACLFAGRNITYGEIDRRGSQVANGLIAAGCGPGARVAVLSKNSDSFLEILSGSMKAGTVLLPLNWRLAAPEIAYILEHGCTQALFVEAEFAALVEDSAAKLIDPRMVRIVGGAAGAADDYATWRDAQSAVDPMVPVAPSDVFVQMYTSGTTGLPKGVQLSHANYSASFALLDAYPWNRTTADDVVFAPAPFFHVNGLNAVLRSVASGARMITADQFRPPEALEIFERERVTRASMAPAMIQMCREVPGVETRDFAALDMIIYGGSPISESVLARARDVFGCAFAQGYGMTEATSAITMLTPDDHRDDSRLRSCGRPLPGAEVRVVRPSGEPCAPREVGEVVGRGPFISCGYWRDPENTARAIEDGWLHTGDAGYFDEEGYLYIHDRVKEMIVSGAENVYPAEVENALFKNPDIADAAVIGVPDERWGEAVKAIVVLRPGAAADPAAGIADVRRHIAGFKAPKSVDFVEAIPRNAAGKILRRDLRQPYWAGRERAVN